MSKFPNTQNIVSPSPGRVGVLRSLCWALAVCAIGFALPASAAAELMIEGTPRWGVDGRARLGRFNLLTVELMNNSDLPWQGTLKLEPMVGISGGDMPIVQPALYLEPYGRRRVQFVVYLPSAIDYRLSWGRSRESSDLIAEPAVSNDPAVIQIAEHDQLIRPSESLFQFDEFDFPPSAAGLETLDTVVLDHVPVWSEAQNRAFLDWLSAGGTLFLSSRDGQPVKGFAGALTPLNEPTDAFPVGNGQVLRQRYVKASATSAETDSDASTVRNLRNFSGFEPTSRLFGQLKSLTQPNHNWPLIYLMAVVYLLLLFPGCWLLGRKKGDFRLTYAVLLGIVCVFSMAFRSVGARGYGEQTRVDSIALARPAADGRVLVTQWTNVFVTDGDEYEIAHQTEGTVYSTGQVYEDVPGFILNRPLSAMLTPIPSFSSRTFLHAGVLAHEPPDLQWVPSDAPEQPAEDAPEQPAEIDTGLDRLTWSNRPAALDAATVVGWAVHHDQVYTLRLSADGLQPGAPQNWTSWRNSLFQAGDVRYQFDSNRNSAQIASDLPLPVIAYDLGIMPDWASANVAPSDNRELDFPDDQVLVYLVLPMTKDFEIKGDRFPRQSGQVVYALTLPAPEPTPASSSEE